jgi:heme A synthase
MKRGFRLYSLLVLLFNLGVIVWGAYVRATGSGAGCGSHWPACNGQVFPRAPSVETMIEFTHRASSGLALLLVIGLVIFARKAFEPRHRVRAMAWAALGLMIVEAILGAGLVLFDLVANDSSVARAVAMPIHLVNTFLLLAAMTLTYAWAGNIAPPRPRGVLVPVGLGLALLATIVLGASGAIAALGDTLFPAQTLEHGLAQDVAGTSHFLLRVRVIHPFIAVFTAGLTTFVAVAIPARAPRPGVRPLAWALVALFVAQVAVGITNLVLLAPVELQLVHLFLADVVWIDLVLLTAVAVAREEPAAEAEATPAPAVA